VTPREARAWIEGLEVFGMRFGLERMRLLLDALGHPERGWAAVHVVGSNGKSSTARLASAALRGEGLRVGTYLSPHVSGWPERIELGGRALGRRRFAAAVAQVRAASDALALPDDDRVTQFEALTAAAFLTFARAGVDAAVVEAGLGGRYDATNVLAPRAAVALTNVALEHTDLLGDTEAAIAAEKLAVVPDGGDRLVVGRLTPPAEAGVDAVLAARGLSDLRLGRDLHVRARSGGIDVATPRARYAGLRLPLAGRFQRDNLAVAIAVCELVLGRRLREPRLRPALAGVRMPGRLEAIPGEPVLVLDGAHNPAGMEAMVASLPDVVGRRRPVAVVSALGDKDLGAMMRPLAAACSAVVATRSRHPRAAAPATLAALAECEGVRAEAIERAPMAVARARALAGRRGAVLVCGSLYLLADLRTRLLREWPEMPCYIRPRHGLVMAGEPAGRTAR
jgi:dihydrofolate synthase/folylpolyglutamate synthase